MSPAVKSILERVAAWPEQDQAELAEVAREIEARRTGVYILDTDEKDAIEKARLSPVVSDEEVSLFWTRRGFK
jgi:hypothetical protein